MVQAKAWVSARTFPLLRGVQSTHAVARSSRLLLQGEAALKISNYPFFCGLVYLIVRTESRFPCLFLRNHLFSRDAVFHLPPSPQTCLAETPATGSALLPCPHKGLLRSVERVGKEQGRV